MTSSPQKQFNSPQDGKIFCPYKNVCAGCQLLDLPYEEQKLKKISELRGLLNDFQVSAPEEIEFVSAGAGHLRDRLDFSLEDSRLGLYRQDIREILDIDICAQLSPALQDFLTDFRKIKFPFKKGSIRLRVGPEGQRGVWLDFANLDIKTLLDEKNILHFLQQNAFVEIGQRRKVPQWNGQEFKLVDPQMNVWFQTWVQGEAVDLHCQVASFTQPSLSANRLICEIIETWVRAEGSAKMIEFGSGIGNLTLPALAAADELVACEIDALSLAGLEATLAHLPPPLKSLKKKISIHRGDFQKKRPQDFSRFDGVLVNPPRSGLMDFLNPLEALGALERPRFIIYMSCFPESMAADVARLKNMNYEISELKIVDQFPQTKHYEVLALLQRK